MEEKLALAYSKLEELLEVHRDHPMTTNSQFINNSKVTRQDNTKDEIETKIKREFTAKFGKVSMEDITRIMSMKESSSSSDMDMMAAEEALDSMIAFYEVLHLLISLSYYRAKELISSRLHSTYSQTMFRRLPSRRRFSEGFRLLFVPLQYLQWIQIQLRRLQLRMKAKLLREMQFFID